MEKKTEKTAFVEFWSDIKKHKKLFCVILPLTFVVSALLSLSIPNYYSCTVKLAPEITGSRSSSSLANLASSFGVNLGNQGSGGDAIVPSLYPDLMNSVTFKASLFPVKVQLEGDSAMTYYDYLLNHQKLPWWTSAIKSLKNRFTEKHESNKVNPFRLTDEQAGIIDMMNEKVVCDVDDNNMVISINVTDQDPLIAATMADSVQMHLQEFITEYRTRKARIDLAYSQKLFKEAKERYEKARKRSASFNDANQKAFLSRVRSEASDLDNEMQLQLRAYSQVAAQLQLAEAKVQEDTPAFTLLQPATVPTKKAGPKRSVYCIFILIIVFILTTVYVLKKENDLNAFFVYLRRLIIRDSFDDDNYYIISRLPSSQEKQNQSNING
jgi:hypothetical protein